ncbi:MAG: DUF1045 domain-containing protein [Variovorax sp.]
MSDAAYRHAIYFAPPVDSAWWQAGSEWLGRCAAQGRTLTQPPIAGVPAPVQAQLTRAPRRYGFHATLKAPFALAPSAGMRPLQAALRDICSTHAAFEMPRMKVAQVDDFLALVPDDGDSSAIDALAAACVKRLQPLAAALSEAELERRRKAGLTPEEDALLLRWGYPFVLERFRFHMSLTGALADAAPDEVEAIERAAEALFGALPAMRFDALSLFAEPTAGADFALVEQMALGA